MATRKTDRKATSKQAVSKHAPSKSSDSTKSLGKARRKGEQVAREQREVQDVIDAKPKKAAKKAPAKTAARKQPRNPMPAQHLEKPGNEHELELAPRYMAPDYKGSGKLEGMAAIVTGADSGIGRSVAVLFAREGCDVAVLHLDEDEDAEVTRKAVEAEGARCLVLAGDVGDTKFCEKAVKKVLKDFGRLDVLVNNAAFQQHTQSITDITDKQFEQTMRTNVGGYFRMARAAIPHMKEGASIINTGSEVALFGSAQLLDYAMTKGAIHVFTKALAAQLLGKGIRVNCVAPGPVWTPLNPADRPAEDVAKFGQDSDAGRPGQPEEMSPAYVLLASPVCSSYINGAILPAMGGPRG